MKTFNDAVAVWAQLLGVHLHSVRPGAELIVREVDFSGGRVVVAAGPVVKSRSFSELRRVWDALVMDSVVHVDSVLGGSGSSRNQPETLFANLPWVRWAVINRKKHLVLVLDSERSAGTLCEALPEEVEAALDVKRRRTGATVELVVPTVNVSEAAARLAALTGQSPEACAPGEYLFLIGSLPIRIVADVRGSGNPIRIQTSLRSGTGERPSFRLGEHLVVSTEQG